MKDWAEFVITLAEVYGYAIPEPRAKIYISILEQKLGKKFEFMALFEQIALDRHVERFPSLAEILAATGWMRTTDLTQLQKGPQDEFRSIQSNHPNR